MKNSLIKAKSFFLGIPVKRPKSNLFTDLLFFIITIVIPSSCFGLIDSEIFYVKGLFDLPFLCWLLTLTFFVFYGRNLFFVVKNTSVKLLIVINVYIIIRFAATIMNGKSFNETFIVFRTFFSPISALALVCFIYQMNSDRISRFFKWTIYSMSIQGLFFVIFHLTGFNIFNVKIYLQETFNNREVMRYYAALPQNTFWVYPISLIQYLYTRKAIWLFPLIIMIISSLLIATRSITIMLIIFMFLIIGLYYKINFIRIAKKSLKITLIALSIYFLFFLFFNAQYEYLIYRLDNVIALNIDEDANYKLRTNLVEQTYKNIYTSLGTLLFGHGYLRAEIAGNYDFVLGGDTNIPGVLYTEGFVGLILRLSIFIQMSYFALKKYYTNSYNKANILIIVSVASIFIGILQSSEFRYMNYTILYLFMLQCYGKEFNLKKETVKC